MKKLTKKSKRFLAVIALSLVVVVSATLIALKEGLVNKFSRNSQKLDSKAPQTVKSLDCVQQQNNNEALFVGCNGIF